MKIHNIRLGYAHNSSSTHSIVVLPQPNAPKLDDGGGLEFGWDYFTVGDPERKMRYLAEILGNGIGKEAASDLTGVGADVAPGWGDPNDLGFVDYIDHDSFWHLPLDFSGRPNLDFAKALVSAFRRDNVAILGGNDNDDHEHKVLSTPGVKTIPLRGHMYRPHGRIRYDASGDYWTLFAEEAEYYSACKLRFSLDNSEKEIVKADRPELVDVKITDYCGFGCSYCYMGSTKKGTHADMKDLEKIADALCAMEVFEVALGGGEPTHHPQFLDILRMFRSRGIIPNFTTRNKEILRGDIRKEIDDLCGSFAFSVDKAETLRSIIASPPSGAPKEPPGMPEYPDTEGMSEEAADRLYNSYWDRRRAFMETPEYKEYNRLIDAHLKSNEVLHHVKEAKFNPPNVQVVMGTVSDKDFEDILHMCTSDYTVNSPGLTLLGYKTTGRGSAFDPKPSDGWVDRYLSLRDKRKAPWCIGIDTVLASQIEGRLKDLNVPDASYETEEGKFSMYIDAVTMRMGKCSYVDDSEYVPLTRSDDMVGEIKSAFARW